MLQVSLARCCLDWRLQRDKYFLLNNGLMGSSRDFEAQQHYFSRASTPTLAKLTTYNADTLRPWLAPLLSSQSMFRYARLPIG